jgi:hypothetical protein
MARSQRDGDRKSSNTTPDLAAIGPAQLFRH